MLCAELWQFSNHIPNKPIMLKTFKILNNYEKKQFFFLAFLVILSLLVELLSLGLILPVTTYIFSDSSDFTKYINNFILFENLDKIQVANILLILLVSAFFIKNLFLSFFYYFESYYLYKTTQNISVKLYKVILFKSIFEHLHRHSSEVVNNLTNETRLFGTYLAALIVLVTEIPILFGICVFLMFIEPIGFLLICTSSIVLGSIYFLLTKKRLAKMGHNRLEADQSKVQYLQEMMNGIKEIKIYKRENYFLSKFNQTAQRVARVYYFYGFFSKLPKLFYEFLFVIIVVLVIFYFNQQNADPGDFIPFLSVLLVASLRILPSLNRIFGSTQQLTFTRPSRDRIYNEIINSDTDLNKNIETEFKNKIRFKKINYSFNAKRGNIISDFSFELQKGDFLSIFGPTGTGKSTLLNLFSGLLEPDSGEIFFDNKKIDYSKTSWFNHISFVPQSTFLYDDSILENIIFGSDKKNINQARLNESIKIAQLETLINRLPDGVNTVIGDNGKKLSGGEKQRIGIARALYKNSDILIFDEATSALDDNTETKLFDSLISSIQKNKLFIFVTHKKSLIRYSNKSIEL